MLRAALAQLPGHRPGTRPGRKVLVRIDGAGSTHKVIDWLTKQRLSYSVGFTLPDNTPDLLKLIPAKVWAPAPGLTRATFASPGGWRGADLG